MSENETLKEIVREVQKLAEIKKAIILKKILRDTPVIDSDAKIQLIKQLEKIRQNLNMSMEDFERVIEKMSTLPPSRPKKVKRKEEEISYSATGIPQNLHEDNSYVQAARKRYCVNAICRYRFITTQVYSEQSIRCRQCGGRTIFVIDHND